VRSKVNETVGRSSVRLSHHSPGGFAAERRARKRYRSPAAGAEQQHGTQQQIALSSKCEQCHVDSSRRMLKLTAHLFTYHNWYAVQLNGVLTLDFPL